MADYVRNDGPASTSSTLWSDTNFWYQETNTKEKGLFIIAIITSLENIQLTALNDALDWIIFIGITHNILIVNSAVKFIT